MLIHSKINIFIRKFLLERLNTNKRLIDKLLEDWDSKENQDFLKSRFPIEKKPKKKPLNKWNKFYKENYKKIKKELGEGVKRKEILAELSKRWKKEKEKEIPKVENTLALFSRPLFEFPDFILPPTSSLHKLLIEILKPEKKVETPSELPISPKSKKNLEKEEEVPNSKAYDAFCEHNINKIKEENPALTYDKITKILAKMWRALSTKEKEKWKNDLII